MARILIIDDSPSMLETLAMMIAGAGHEVRTCADGSRASKMMGHEGLDLILTDVFMPQKDGLEAIEEARGLWPQLPVVAMSGMIGSLDMLPVAKRWGACHLLRKPFTKTQLLAAVGVALGTQPTAGEGKIPTSGNRGQQ